MLDFKNVVAGVRTYLPCAGLAVMAVATVFLLITAKEKGRDTVAKVFFRSFVGSLVVLVALLWWGGEVSPEVLTYTVALSAVAAYASFFYVVGAAYSVTAISFFVRASVELNWPVASIILGALFVYLSYVPLVTCYY